MENKFERQKNSLTIGAFAKAAGVNVETIRFYQRKGLLSEPDKPLGSIRRYGGHDVARIKFVKSAQQLGFSLEEIAELLRLQDGTQCSEARTLAQHKLIGIRQKLADLTRMEAALNGLVEQCCGTVGNVACPLISALHSGAGAGASTCPKPPAA
ncbi:Hg(II)-responsive transcriptional regulator [Rhodoferax sp.]|uniref:Hg(II)-responsive transcriptional regulator n=1 Tax=Rhodoferax sp. TaxID=50421 RepID=UPI0019FE566B|nr:Hg(II)-responsive transcriptional regulator [Rhodoferax sp.]MBE0472637.1 Hg(II)-responsive transcriptional regulator [Rhodoferax sp.]